MKFNVTWGTGKQTTLETSETMSVEAFAMERWGRTLEEVNALGVQIEEYFDTEAEPSVTPVVELKAEPVVTLVPEAAAAVEAAVQSALDDDDDGGEDTPLEVVVVKPSRKHRG